MNTRERLDSKLLQHGLHVRGVASLDAAEIESCGLDPQQDELALVGNVGSSYWPYFSTSSEFTDGAPDPLDRWSRRVAGAVAAELGLRPIYPFDGPPYYPFQQWARRAEALEQSPIGVMMHPEIGLWHSYRFALAGSNLRGSDAPVTAPSPCDSCRDRPCLHTCPVDAFDGDGYAVDRCARYLEATPAAQCHQQGCLARHACPVAPEFRYLAEQGRFHLQAFLRARPAS